MALKISQTRYTSPLSTILTSLADLADRALDRPVGDEMGGAEHQLEPKPVITIEAGLITNLMSMR